MELIEGVGTIWTDFLHLNSRRSALQTQEIKSEDLTISELNGDIRPSFEGNDHT